MSELRNQVVAEIMKMVRPEPVKMEKPSIEELERILNSENPDRINMAPDGSVTLQPASTTTVGSVADAVIPLILEACAKIADDQKSSAQRARKAKGIMLHMETPGYEEIVGEERGERIASEMIAKAIRALKV